MDEFDTPPASAPSGVDPHSWLAFEGRIQVRRFAGLLEAMETALARADGDAARAALAEARALRPGAPELAEFERRVAGLPLVPPPDLPPPLRRRAAHAVLMLAAGVLLIAGADVLRSGREAPRPGAPLEADYAHPAVVQVPVLPAFGDGEGVDLTEGPVREPDASPVRAVAAAPAPARPPESARESRMSPRAAADARPLGVNGTRTGAEGAARGEISDDYVAPRTRPPVAAAAVPAPPALAPAPPAPTGPADESRIDPGDTLERPVSNTPPPAAAAARGSVPTLVRTADAEAVDRLRVADVLRRYARAYTDLNATAAREVWPTVNERALARAFEGLASQQLSFDSCDIDVQGASAQASCRGEASYVGKVGSGEPRTEQRAWRFELRRDGDAWKIENAEARRLSSSSH